MNKYEIFIFIGVICSVIYAIWSDKNGIKHKFV